MLEIPIKFFQKHTFDVKLWKSNHRVKTYKIYTIFCGKFNVVSVEIWGLKLTCICAEQGRKYILLADSHLILTWQRYLANLRATYFMVAMPYPWISFIRLVVVVLWTEFQKQGTGRSHIGPSSVWIFVGFKNGSAFCSSHWLLKVPFLSRN